MQMFCKIFCCWGKMTALQGMHPAKRSDWFYNLQLYTSQPIW